jgi:hypothetical protein
VILAELGGLPHLDGQAVATFAWCIGRLAAIAGAVAVGMSWLRGQIDTMIGAAFLAHHAVDDAWRRGMETQFKDMKDRQDGQSTSISEAHRRIDKILEARA